MSSTGVYIGRTLGYASLISFFVICDYWRYDATQALLEWNVPRAPSFFVSMILLLMVSFFLGTIHTDPEHLTAFQVERSKTGAAIIVLLSAICSVTLITL